MAVSNSIDERGKGPAARQPAAVPILLAACLAIVIFWELMAHRSRRPFDPFDLRAAALAGFRGEVSGWQASVMDLPADDPSAPNIMAMMLRREDSAPVTVRLVHGYNMPDCMRLKGYKVELLEDMRRDSGGDAAESARPAAGADAGTEAGVAPCRAAGAFPCQVWRLTSDIGEEFICSTAMLRASDFGLTDIDIRSMPFPRVGPWNDPTWDSQGLTWRSLRHPVRNFTAYIRAKWDNSRCDAATFLKLRRPAWASSEVLTLVARSSRAPAGEAEEADTVGEVLSAQSALYARLHQWRLESAGHEGK